MDGTVYQSLFMTIMRAQESDGTRLDYVSSAYGSSPDIGSGMNGKEVNKKKLTRLVSQDSSAALINACTVHLIWKILDRLLQKETTDTDYRCKLSHAAWKHEAEELIGMSFPLEQPTRDHINIHSRIWR